MQKFCPTLELTRLIYRMTEEYSNCSRASFNRGTKVLNAPNFYRFIKFLMTKSHIDQLKNRTSGKLHKITNMTHKIATKFV